MKLSIVTVSLALVFAAQVSAEDQVCVQQKKQSCGESWWNRSKNNAKNSIDIVNDKWSSITTGVQQQLKEGSVENVVAAINVKKDFIKLLPNLVSTDVGKIVDKLIADGNVGAIVEAYQEDPKEFDRIVKTYDVETKMNLGLIISYYENVGDFLGTKNPYEMAKEFPRTREQLLIKLVKYGLLKKFPEAHAELDDGIEDVVPYIQGIITEMGDKTVGKTPKKFAKLATLINFAIGVTNKVTGGKAFSRVETFVSKLDGSFDDEAEEEDE